MKREYLFLMLFALLGFTGGTTTQVWLSADGSLAAPAYSFASETDLGFYRKAATQVCAANGNDADSLLCFDDGSILVSSDGTAQGYVKFDTSATGVGYRYLDSTNDFNVWAAESSTLDFFIGTYNNVAMIGNTADTLSTTGAIGFDGTSGGMLVVNTAGNVLASSSQGIGYAGDGLKMSVGDKLYMNSTNNYITQNATDSLAYYANSTLMMYSRNKDLVEAASGKYLQFISANGGLTGAMCASAAHQGRIVPDYSTNRLYICNYNNSKAWMYVDLNE